VRLYLEVARRSFRRHLAYRSATLAGLFTNAIFGVMIASVFAALYDGDPNRQIAGFSRADALTYVWIGQAMIMPLFLWGWWEVAAAVASGDVVADLMKPFDFETYWLSRDLGRAACHLLTRFTPTILFGAFLYDLALPRPSDLGAWFGFGLSLLLAIVVSFAWRFLLNLAAFWLLDARGVQTIALLFVNFFSGFLVPLAFFPGWLRTVAEALPFRAFVMVPIEVALGQRGLASAVALQLFWVAALLLLGRGALALAERKVVVQGG